MIQVEQGHVGNLYFEVLEPGGAGTPFTPLNPRVDVFDETNTEVLGDAVPTVVQIGLLRLAYSVPVDAGPGIWRALLTATGYQGNVFFEVIEEGASSDPVDPLATFGEFVARLGYTPIGDEAIRAEHLLRSASALIRDTAGDAGEDWTAATATPRIKDICISVAYRAFTNPEPLNQHTLGDENKGFDRAAVGGGEMIYLTKSEQRAVKKAGGGSSFRSVPLVSPFSGDDEVLEIIQVS